MAEAATTSSTIPQSPDCRGCYEKQVRRIATFCNLSDDVLSQMLDIKDSLLEEIGGERVKPTHMGTLLERIMPLVGTNDPASQNAWSKLLLPIILSSLLCAMQQQVISLILVPKTPLPKTM